MKKTLLLTGMVCIISCQANAMDIKPYIGADMGASHAELQGFLDGFDDNFAVANINAGIRFNDYFGLETSVQSSSEAETYGLDLSYSSINLDALGYIPLNKNWELIGSVGAGYYTFDLGTDIGDGYDLHIQTDEFAFRTGIGLQYNFNEKWAMRGVARYAFIDSDEVDSITELTLGVRYNF